MNTILQIILICGSILFCIFILAVTQKKKLSYKYTLVWLILGFITLLIIVIIFYISLAFSKQSEKVTTLIQENAMLMAKVEKLEKESKEKNSNENS